MTDKQPSFASVFYDLRPAKQVERRMIVDVFQALAEQGLPLRDYRYVGMGSIYFADFILFHRYLGIGRLLSAEIDKGSERRVKFNRPYRCVEIRMEEIGLTIPILDRDEKHILWLDYDGPLIESMIQDLILGAQRLAPGLRFTFVFRLDVSLPHLRVA